MTVRRAAVTLRAASRLRGGVDASGYNGFALRAFFPRLRRVAKGEGEGERRK